MLKHWLLSSTDSDEEKIPLDIAENSKPESKAEDLKVAEPKKANSDDESDEDEDEIGLSDESDEGN
ncbi:hypothetical protein TSUD_107090 [Trifolium subterraneum]|uniref:Uncharacterized protein n=1 Tax=Trifolium subterraneum TaxID=3900 RepID=A0A2Z6MGF7_TRISU|nr:hypothetical protein TSUD_107090 [Trifolium subterraneum]